MADIDKIKQLLYSRDSDNIKLGWVLDKSLNNGNLRKGIEEDCEELLNWFKKESKIWKNLPLDEMFSWTWIDIQFKNQKVFTKLNRFPSTLKNLTSVNCSDHNHTSFPELPKLTELICSNNKLVKLPNFTNLTYLDCSMNDLIKLGNMPKLKTLICNNNDELILPKSLPKLDCLIK